MNETAQNTEITLKDHAVNSFQAGLLLIPVVGAPLEKLMFGTLGEKRSRRVEKTLEEIGKKLDDVRACLEVDDNEDLANLLESVLPQTAKATNENKRQRFRDLIFNAVQVPSGDARWEEAGIAAALLAKIDTVGLEIVASMYASMLNYSSNDFVICEVDENNNAISDALIESQKPKVRFWALAVANAEDTYSRAKPMMEGATVYRIPGNRAMIKYPLENLDDIDVVHHKDEHSFFAHVGDGQYFDLLVDWIISDEFDGESPSSPSVEQPNP